MKHYNYDKITGELLGEENSIKNPREKGKFLFPAFSTTSKPPQTSANEIAVFSDDNWAVVQDFRGGKFYKENGEEIVISELNIEPEQNWTTEQPPPSLNTVKTIKKQDLKSLYNQKIEAGFLFEGNSYQIRDGDRMVMTVVMLNFSRGKAAAHHGFWRSLDNQMIAMTDTKVQEFIDSVEVYGATLYATLWAHADAIAALDNTNDIDNYDVAINWPSNT